LSRLSIRLLLGVLAGILVVLALAIGVLNGITVLRLADDRAEQSARQVAQTAASSLESYLEDADASLRRLAADSRATETFGAACEERMRRIGPLLTEFFQLGLFDADGRLVCASVPVPKTLTPDVGAEAWFRALRRGDTLRVGPPRQLSVGTWVSPMGFPIRAEDGEFEGAVVGTVDLDRFQRLLSAVRLPEGGLITLSRIEDAVVVARTRNAEAWVGREIRDQSIPPARLRRGGVNEEEGMDGVTRIWGYAPVPQADWVVFAGFPLSWIRGPAWNVILGTGLLTLVLLGLALFLGSRVHRIIVGSVRELVTASREAARGRADRISTDGPPEIQELAAAFNRTLHDRAILDHRLREAEKTEALARLSGGIAHDFRNLLTVVTGETSLARAELDDDDPVLRNLRTIEDAARRAADLTRKLLAFGRQDPGDAGPVDLNARIEEEVHLLSLTLGDDHRIRTELDPDAGVVLCGERRLRVILRELVQNAVDALPTGGVVEIRTGLPDAPLPDAGNGGDEPPVGAMAAYLEVRDQGEGMSPRVRERIFEPFFSTRPRERGTGMGLPTVHGLTRQIGGRLRLESEPGRGTRVRVYFPPAEAPPPRPAAQERR